MTRWKEKEERGERGREEQTRRRKCRGGGVGTGPSGIAAMKREKSGHSVCVCAVGNAGAALHTTSREEETVQYFVGRDILCQGLGVVGLGCACIAWSIAKIVLCTSCVPSVHWFATVWRRNWGGLHAGGTRQWWTAVILQMRSGKRYITLHYTLHIREGVKKHFF